MGGSIADCLPPIQNLTDQLALFLPGGADYVSHFTTSPPPIFGRHTVGQIRQKCKETSNLI